MKKIDVACVIDDDEIYTFTIKRLIDKSQIASKTLFFENGKLAIDFFNEFLHKSADLPDLILLDINMPVLDGWQFMDEFIKLSPHINKRITVYMVSSSVDQADIDKAKSYNQISDFIVKPVSAAMFRKMTESLAA